MLWRFQVKYNETISINDKLFINNTAIHYCSMLCTCIMIYLCFINSLCRRYYFLWFSYVWSSLLFFKILLFFYWSDNRFESTDGYGDVVTVPDDSYLEYTNNILVKSIIYIPSFLFSCFICRHVINFIYLNNIHIQNPKRYPHKCDDILYASMYDMYEIFFTPVMHTCYVLFIILFICCICIDDNSTSHFETSHSENNLIIEKDIGFMKLETLYEKQSVFDRMV